MVFPCGSKTDGFSVTNTRACIGRFLLRTPARRSRPRGAAVASRSNAPSISSLRQHRPDLAGRRSSSSLKSVCCSGTTASRCAGPTRTPARARRRAGRARAARCPRTTTPRDRARFSRIRSGYTTMPDTMRVKRRSMWSSAMKLSGRMTRSTDECEMSRSCQSATFSSAAIAFAAKQPRQPDDLLAADRVALVRHRRRALLPARRTAPRPRRSRSSAGRGSPARTSRARRP